MTEEKDFLQMMDVNVKDWQTRLVFADWLQDRDDLRAEGYRALGRCRLNPWLDRNDPIVWSWIPLYTGRCFGNQLVYSWFKEILWRFPNAAVTRMGGQMVQHVSCVVFPTFLGGLDAAAVSFHFLLPAVKEYIMKGAGKV